MAGPVYPDVPATAGVPPVNRSVDNPADSSPSAQLTSDSSGIAQQASRQWGIYTQAGAMALNPDNIAAFSYDAEYRIADYAIEQGGFVSYDKVAVPFDTTVRMSKGGLLADRTAFLAAIETIRVDTNLYNIITPEATYMGVNMARISIERSAESGANMVIASVHFREIRQTATQKFSSTKAAASAAPANNGTTQATAPSPAVNGATFPNGKIRF